MNHNEENSDIQTELLNEMPSGYSKVKGNWMWEMMKAFAINMSLFQVLCKPSEWC